MPNPIPTKRVVRFTVDVDASAIGDENLSAIIAAGLTQFGKSNQPSRQKPRYVIDAIGRDPGTRVRFTGRDYEEWLVPLDAPARPAPLERAELYTALALLCERIEACGASPELTDAVSLASDLLQATGSDRHLAYVEAAGRVRDALAASSRASFGLQNPVGLPGSPSKENSPC